jgi:hypothetical protein
LNLVNNKTRNLAGHQFRRLSRFQGLGKEMESRVHKIIPEKNNNFSLVSSKCEEGKFSTSQF